MDPSTSDKIRHLYEMATKPRPEPTPLKLEYDKLLEEYRQTKQREEEWRNKFAISEYKRIKAETPPIPDRRVGELSEIQKITDPEEYAEIYGYYPGEGRDVSQLLDRYLAQHSRRRRKRRSQTRKQGTKRRRRNGTVRRRRRKSRR